MNNPDLMCRDERRRQSVRDQADEEKGLNGIDYIEVIEDTEEITGDAKKKKQHQLCVHFFGDVPQNIDKKNVRIEGGERIRDIKVVDVYAHRSDDPEHEDCLRVTVDKDGDFSCYKLCLYELEKDGDSSRKLMRGFDPRYACATFSFKVNCPSTLDCRDENTCPPEARVEPDINYLAKDYSSFRQLLLDRLALLVPDWRERHIPDIGIALVEMLAYAGDYLSYYQDAVATEAYLDTARKRISVRRHARLVDYFMHEGCNSRAWVCIDTNTNEEGIYAKDFYFVTGCKELAKSDKNVFTQESFDKLNISPAHYDVFEPLVKDESKAINFYAAHSEINFYTWGNEECCLPPGATGATLRDEWEEDDLPPVEQNPDQQQTQAKKAEKYGKQEKPAEPRKRNRALRYLKVNDVLIFEEVFGAKTGDKADANPAHRCAVRLTRVEPRTDPLTKYPIVKIEWAQEDALPFSLCLSARLLTPDCRLIKNVSVARGNVILVDYGKTIYKKIEDAVPTTEKFGECLCEDGSVESTYIPGKFQITLKNSPLTFSQPLLPKSPAAARLLQNPRKSLPQITLYGKPAAPDGKKESFDPQNEKWKWHPKFDLLSSNPDERSFVVEIDNDGRARIRFGNGECGQMPAAGMTFTAKYRIGNGKPGNVGAETIKYIVTRNLQSGSSMKPRNPMPAQGGISAEPISEVKMFAPGAFRKRLERAITAEDYAHLAMRNPKVQVAAAQLRWTGSWHEARVDIDSLGATELSGRLRRESKGSLYPYRRIGHDLSVTSARYVPLDIQLKVLVAPRYLRGHVEAALLDAFSNGVLENGRYGFFHPDNLTFGGGIYLSALVAAAQTLEGVVGVTVTRLQRLFESANEEIEHGVLSLGANEIARLDNNPNFPERGRLKLILEGGR
jgi:hypothetical protein